jgi:hypothetical protein
VSDRDPIAKNVEALADELLRGPRDRLRMIPYYADARNEIIKPQRHQVITDYFTRRWLPRLGPTLTLLVIALRRHCYYNEITKQQEDWCFPHQRDLAAELGVSRRTVQRELSRPEAQLFVRREPQYRYDRERNRMIRTVDRYRITMDDPLTPEDERQLVVKLAERLIREGNTQFSGSEILRRQSVAYGEETPNFPQSDGLHAPRSGDISDLTQPRRQVDAYEGLHRESEQFPPRAPASIDTRTRDNRPDIPAPDPSRGAANTGDGRFPHLVLLNVNTPSQPSQEVTSFEALMAGLVRCGVTEDVARSLLGEFDPARVARQLEWITFRQVRDPAAALVDAIRRDWAPPPAWRENTAREAEPMPPARSARDKEAAAARAREERLEALVASLPEDRRTQLWEQARALAVSDWGDNPMPPPAMLVRAKLRSIVEQEGQVGGAGAGASNRIVDDRPKVIAEDLAIVTDGRAEMFLSWFEATYGIAIRSRSRVRDTVQARRIAWLVLRTWGLSYARIGAMFGCDHTTVRDAIQVALSDPDLQKAAAACRGRFEHS